MAQRFAVRRSSIHGRGAFAAGRLRAGQRVGEYTGEALTYAESETRPGNDDGHTMLFDVGDDLVLDGRRGGNDARFINHSCAPNCEVVIVRRRPVIYALRAIAPGEELTYDYALAIDGPFRAVWAKRYECRCGARRCRGMMLKLRAQNRVGKAYAALAASRPKR